MISTRFKRAGGIVAASALLVAGAVTAHAVDVTEADIYEDETSRYDGWHQGDPNGQDSYRVTWQGLNLGYNGQAQVINGLVNKNQPGIEVGEEELLDLITSSEFEVVDGAVHHQVAIFYYPDANGTKEFSTLRPVNAAGPGTATFAADDEWRGSGTDLNTDRPLEDIIADLFEQNERVELLSYGVLALDDSTVASVTWGGETFNFVYPLDAIPVSAQESIAVDDIRPNEETYLGWHEGRDNEIPAFDAVCEGLIFGINDTPSEIINGFDESSAILIDSPDGFDHMASLITSTSVDVEEGQMALQIPIFVFDGSDGQEFATLRPVNPAGPGEVTYSLDEDWVSSGDLNAVDISGNQPMPLGDLLTQLNDPGYEATVVVIGYGMQAWSAPATVSGITFNGLATTFEGLDCVPLTPLEPATPVDEDAPAPVEKTPGYTG